MSHKKDLQKLALKEEMRTDILLEIQNEQLEILQNELHKKFPKCIPTCGDFNISSLNNLFITVVKNIDNANISQDEIKTVEKAKEQVEKAIAMLIKAQSTLNSLLQ